MNTFWHILLSIIGGISTFYLSEKLKWGPVKSSAVLALFFSLIVYIINYLYPINYAFYLALFYGSTFIGMTSNEVFSVKKIVFASILFGLIYSLANPYFNLAGGSLGTAACISVIVVYLAQKLYYTIKSYE